MKTKNNRSQPQTWLSAIADAAARQRFALPPFDAYGMGALRTATVSGRFVTLKRLIRPAHKSADAGIEWALWHQRDELPALVASFRDPLEPEQQAVAATLSLLKGWLVDQWSPDEAKEAVSKHPRVQAIKEFPQLS